MNLAFQNKVQKKTLFLALAGAASLLIIAITTLIVTIMASKPTATTKNIPQSAQLKNLEQSQSRLSQTLQQEKADRASVHEAVDASSNYQKLAQ